jgi:isopenicillin-N epimerase
MTPDEHTPDWFDLWALDPEITFLNHGSFGACPRAILEAQQGLRARMEGRPIQFLARDLEPLLDQTREVLGGFVGADPDDLALVPNATTGVNTVLNSLPLEAGDELLVTDHEYNACRNALDWTAACRGARVVVVALPFPLGSPDEIVAAVLESVGPQTRLLLIDQITSPTGMVLPVDRIVLELRRRGIDTLVDGAHAPGMVPLNLRETGAAYFTGNCHKWLCTPKGAAFLHVRKDRQAGIRPLAISHGANSPRRDRSLFRLEFDWTGTDDPTPYLCIPESIRYLGSLLPGGWPALMERNRALAVEAREIVCRTLGVAPPCPESMIGTLATIPLPDGVPGSPQPPLYLDPLQDELLERYRIEIPVVPWPVHPKRWVRLSVQLYNRREQYEDLARALRELLGQR